MKWKKLGHIFAPKDNHLWMISHAANPVAEHIQSDLFRIFFSCRNSLNQSSVGYVEIDICNPCESHRVSHEPVLIPGNVGAFDDSGASISCIVGVGSKRYMYYLGWNLGVTVPWRNSIGLSVSDSTKAPFRRIYQAPIMDRNEVDPFSLSYPCVIRDNNHYKMWYGSNLSWGPNQSDMNHVIKYAESDDGIVWRREGVVAIDFKDSREYAISRPWVIRDSDCWRMWYSYRGESYLIGYAESGDGVHWSRKDSEVGIDISETGWDSEMIEYPCVFDHNGERYMLYNGNGYGKTGFGLSVLEHS